MHSNASRARPASCVADGTPWTGSTAPHSARSMMRTRSTGVRSWCAIVQTIATRARMSFLGACVKAAATRPRTASRRSFVSVRVSPGSVRRARSREVGRDNGRLSVTRFHPTADHSTGKGEFRGEYWTPRARCRSTRRQRLRGRADQRCRSRRAGTSRCAGPGRRGAPT